MEASALRLRQVHLRHRGKAREEEPVSPETWGCQVFGSKVGATEGAGQGVGRSACQAGVRASSGGVLGNFVLLWIEGECVSSPKSEFVLL